MFEDPVTGSAHCSLVPFWADRIFDEGEKKKKRLVARQISARGGILFCELREENKTEEEEEGSVLVRGHATTYLSGKIHVPKV